MGTVDPQDSPALRRLDSFADETQLEKQPNLMDAIERSTDRLFNKAMKVTGLGKVWNAAATFGMGNYQKKDDNKREFEYVIVLKDFDTNIDTRATRRQIQERQRIVGLQKQVLSRVHGAGLLMKAERVETSEGTHKLFLFVRATSERLLEEHQKIKAERFLQDFSFDFMNLAQDTVFAPSPADVLVYIDHILQGKYGPKEEGCHGVNIQDFMQDGDDSIVEQVFPLQDHEFNARFLEKLTGQYALSDGDIQHIRNYFGERIAFYFAWSRMYNVWLQPLAAVGILLSLLWSIDEWLYKNVTPIYAVVFILWTTLFLEYWKRRANELSVIWNVKDYQNRSQPNPLYRPPTGGAASVENLMRKAKFLCVGLPFVFVQVLVLLGVTTVLFLLELVIYDVWRNGGVLQLLAKLAFNILFGAILTLMFYLFAWFSIKLNRWENHKTVQDYEMHYTLKLFVSAFASTFLYYFILAFIYIPYGNDLQAWYLPRTPFQINVNRLSAYIRNVFLVSSLLVSFLQVLWPYMQMRFKANRQLRVARRHLERREAEMTLTAHRFHRDSPGEPICDTTSSSFLTTDYLPPPPSEDLYQQVDSTTESLLGDSLVDSSTSHYHSLSIAPDMTSEELSNPHSPSVSLADPILPIASPPMVGAVRVELLSVSRTYSQTDTSDGESPVHRRSKSKRTSDTVALGTDIAELMDTHVKPLKRSRADLFRERFMYVFMKVGSKRVVSRIATESKGFGRFPPDEVIWLPVCDPTEPVLLNLEEVGEAVSFSTQLFLSEYPLNRVQEEVIPMIIERDDLTEQIDIRLKVTRSDDPFASGISTSSSLLLEDVLDQCTRPVFDIFDEYAGMVIQFGYIVLFSQAFPPAAVVAIILNVIEIRMDAIKLIRNCQRPIPKKQSGIGPWVGILSFCGWLCVIVNIALAGVTFDRFTHYFCDLDPETNEIESCLSRSTSLLIAVIFERFALALRMGLCQLISESPSWVTQKLESDKAKFKEEYYHLVKEGYLNEARQARRETLRRTSVIAPTVQ